MNLESLDCKVHSLAVFRKLQDDEVINLLWRLLDNWKEVSIEHFISAYSEFVEKLYQKNINLSEYILKRVLEDENFYIIGKAQGKEFDSLIVETVENELKVFQELSRLTPEYITSGIDYYDFLPRWKTSEIDFVAEYHNRIANIGKYGYGKYSQNRM